MIPAATNVSIEWVIDQLQLESMPKPQALEILLQYVSEKDLPIYFNESFTGTDANEAYELIYDNEGEVTDILIANGYSEIHEDKKQLIDAGLSFDGGHCAFHINKYLFNDRYYYPTEETGMYLKTVALGLDSFYCINDEVAKFKKTLGLPSDEKSVIKKNATIGEPGVRKALALLAREKAENTAYQKGNSVNAKMFKDHILKLAIKYNISDGQLKSLDDKINETLKQLELKELPPPSKNKI